MFTALNNAYQDHTDHDGQGTSPYQLISILGSALTSQTPGPYETEPERRAQADEDDISADTERRTRPAPELLRVLAAQVIHRVLSSS
jgi:hypothetical protein